MPIINRGRPASVAIKLDALLAHLSGRHLDVPFVVLFSSQPIPANSLVKSVEVSTSRAINLICLFGSSAYSSSQPSASERENPHKLPRSSHAG